MNYMQCLLDFVIRWWMLAIIMLKWFHNYLFRILKNFKPSFMGFFASLGFAAFTKAQLTKGMCK